MMCRGCRGGEETTSKCGEVKKRDSAWEFWPEFSRKILTSNDLETYDNFGLGRRSG
jgi:hypothetical protein